MLLDKRVPFTFIVEKIKFEFIAITIFSFVIGYLDEKFIFISIPTAAPTILGTSISLLLAFRTAQAYDRWWEARIIWGAIVNHSRTFIREVKTFLPDDNVAINNFVQKQIAWCYTLGQRLRGESQQNTINQYLTDTEIHEIKDVNNIPNAILDLQAAEVKAAYNSKKINEFQEVRLMDVISKLCDCMGMCERIKTTVFPKTYSALIEWLIYIFAAMLPFSLTDYPPFIEESLNIIISCAFFLIEKTAISKQDPFEGRPTDTAMTSIARTIEINLLQMTEQESVPEPLTTKKFYIM